MQRARPVGRARVRRYRGRAQVAQARTPEAAGGEPAKTNVLASMFTNVLRVDRPPPPVFVDESGRRRRRLRLAALLALGLAIIVLVTVWLTQLSTSVRPGPVSPCGPSAAASPPAVSTGCGR